MRACLLIFGVCLILQSCREGHEAEIKRVDSLITVLNTHETTFNANSKRALEPVINEISQTVKFIADSIKDSLTVPEAKMCNQYHSIGVTLNSYESKFPEIKEQLAIGKKQLNDLKTDLKNHSVPSDSVGSYLKSEQNRVEILAFNIRFLDSTRTVKIASYDSLKPNIENLVQKYSRH
jgi:hypothetical protein